MKQREIKFRYHWTEDGPECALPYPVISIFGFGPDMEIQVQTGDEPHDTAEYDLTGGVLCQYTGLKDKNGKDIYEGDILSAHYAGSAAGEYRNRVVWNEGECAWNFANAPLWTWERIEVIGNVHENPELLN